MSDNEVTAEVITQSEWTTEELVTEIRRRISNTTQNIVEIGLLLIKAKSKVPMENGANGLRITLISQFVLLIGL